MPAKFSTQEPDLAMGLKIACQMDPIERVDISGDSTFAMLLEAQARGHEIFYYTPRPAVARWRHAEGQRHDGHGQRPERRSLRAVGPAHGRSLAAWDVVLLRQDPPFDMSYITTTHLLERLPASTLVVNNPREVRNAPEKIWVLDFLDLMPPTLVARQLEEIRAFRDKYKDIIVKPLYGNGGAGVFRLQPGDTNSAPWSRCSTPSFARPSWCSSIAPRCARATSA